MGMTTPELYAIANRSTIFSPEELLSLGFGAKSSMIWLVFGKHASTTKLSTCRLEKCVAILIVTASETYVALKRVIELFVVCWTWSLHSFATVPPDVAHLQLLPAHPTRHDWSTHAQPTRANCACKHSSGCL